MSEQKYTMINLSGLEFEVNEEMRKHAIRNGIPESNFTPILEDIQPEDESELDDDFIEPEDEPEDELKLEKFDTKSETLKFKKIKVKKLKP